MGCPQQYLLGEDRSLCDNGYR